MPIVSRYDREADALYVTLQDGVRARAVEIDETTYVDVDQNGQALGIEFLYPAMGIALSAVVDQFLLHQQLHAIAAAITRSAAPAPTITMTGATGTPVSTSITTVAVEGTTPASQGKPAVGITHGDRFICA